MIAKLRAYWKWITGAIGVAAGVGAAIYGGGEVVVKADDWKDGVDAGIVVAQQTRIDVDGLLEIEKLKAERERVAAEQEREKWRQTLQYCLADIITDERVCAEAEARMR